MSLSTVEVRVLAEKAMAKVPGGPSMFEQRLWEFAEASPQGNKLITANLANDPYLLRVYLTPERKQLEKTLAKLNITNDLAVKLLTTARPYLHHFFRGDEDREVHNHPWQRAVSLILTSGYKEYRWNAKHQEFGVTFLKPGRLNFIRRNDYHRVELYKDQGCWTLFTSIGRVMASNGKDWNFLNTETGLVTPWGDWHQG